MKISIITITYNSERTLESTIQSIIRKNYENLEYIIVDGGSTDGTLNIIQNYESAIAKWVSEPDEGISDAFNKGIAMATGELIGIINSDDMLIEGALSKISESIQPNTDVLFGNGIRIYTSGKQKAYGANPDLSRLDFEMSLVHPAVFIRKRAYEQYGVFDKSLKMVMDRDLLLRMRKAGARFQYLDEALIYYRMGGASDRNYLKKVLPEDEKISVKYGMSRLKAKMYSLKKFTVFCLVKLRDALKHQ